MTDINQEPNEETTSLVEILLRYVRYWKWFVLGIIVALASLFVYLRYTTPIYKVSASIVLKEADKQSSQPIIGGMESIQLGALGAVSNIDNEIYILQSRSIIRNVVNRLNLHTSYIVEGRIKSTDLYNSSPVEVSMSQEQLNSLQNDIEFRMTTNSDNSRVRVSGIIGGAQIDTLFTTLPAQLHTAQGNISFTEREGASPRESNLLVTIQHPNAVIGHYRSNLTIQQASKQASVLDLSLNTAYPKKGEDFLNTLVEVYNNETIEDNKMEAFNTQAFINERIVIIDKELSDADQEVEVYKQSEGLSDLQVDLQRNMQMGSQYEQQLVQVETQLNIVNSLNQYVNNPSNINKTIPSNIGIEDPNLAATTSEYNRLVLERERLSQSMTDNNPAMIRLDEQIAGLRQNINSSINSVQQGLNIQRRDARNQANIYGGKVGNLPTQEREFIELSREQQIKASLFLMLLQKREENALELAATANSAKILDEAILESKVSPRTMILLLAALMLGVLIPAVIIYITDLLSFKIKSRADIDRVSRIPVLGEIPRNGNDNNIAVAENSTTPIDEAFRMARTNLLFSLGRSGKVALFTSTEPGEGKTFVALNMAISTALLNKKVLLVGLDLRKPAISKYMGKQFKEGFTNYLSGFNTDINSLIMPSDIHPNLDILPSGPIPPNPAELLSRDELDTAFSDLRDKYDYIYIDSAPAALVTDTLIISRVTDATIYICRVDYSNKAGLRHANDLMEKEKLKNMMLIINDVREIHRQYGYGYG
ncbi:MAG: polysaccharide biosynthesis tyrosine autokinase, partial [Fermentimonas sp.]|nr:polysaccharide biosynthesis tyrosine autokinase [Fermentimonas sp.]